MGNLTKLSLGLIICSTLANGQGNILTNKVDDFTQKVQTAIETDNVYQFFAGIGVNNLNRDVKSSNADYTVDTLYEVEAGVIFLPESYKISLGYKTAVNNGKSRDYTYTASDNSKPRSIVFSTELLSNKDYGYLNFEYANVTLNSALKNTGSTNIYMLEHGSSVNPSGFQELAPGQIAQAKEKTEQISFAYRLPQLPNLGITAGYFDRTIPMLIEKPSLSQVIASDATKADGMVYGIGYFEDFEKAPKNKLVFKRVAYALSDLDAKTTDANGNVIKGTAATESLLVDIGYKFSKFELMFTNRYTKTTAKDFNDITVSDFSQTELATNLSVVVKF